MIERIRGEFEFVKQTYPTATLTESARWIQIRDWSVNPTMWSHTSVTVGFRIPEKYPGEQPYGFYVLPLEFRLATGNPPAAAQAASDTPDGVSWLKFSWGPEEGQWRPAAEIHKGSNLINIINSIRARLNDPT